MVALVTIERHILEQQREFPHATGAFTNLMYDIALAAKLIARETTRAGLADILGTAESTNIHGEEQQKLDVFADQTIWHMNDHTGRLCVMASEEQEDIQHIPEKFPCGKYILVYDPLDGSTNVDVNASMGTIFGIYRKESEGVRGHLSDVLQPGHNLVAAGYVVYGPSTMLVYSAGTGVHGFTLDQSVGEFFLSHPDIKIPPKPRYYSCNQGYYKHWLAGSRAFTDYVQGLDSEGSLRLDSRYSGALVADFHRILLKGGIYFYPADSDRLTGKLRLVYEGAPLAFLARHAGGYASDGVGDVLDIHPHSLHQRIPYFVGHTSLVQKAEALLRQYDQEWLETYQAYRMGITADKASV